jgi:hypothetical protein
MQVGGQNENTSISVLWHDVIGRETNGRVGDINFGPHTVQSLWEVTTTTSDEFGFQRIMARANKIAAWAPGGAVLHVKMVLAVDRGFFMGNKLTDAQRAQIVNKVVGAGGYISLQRDLASDAIQATQDANRDLVAGPPPGGSAGGAGQSGKP